MDQFLEALDRFVSNDVRIKDNFWSKEFMSHVVTVIKHVASGKFTIKTSIRPYFHRNLLYILNKGRMEIDSLQELYQQDSRFVLYNVPVESFEEAWELCYRFCTKYKNDERLLTSRTSNFFYKELPQELIDIIDGALAGDGCLIERYRSGHFQLTLSIAQLGHMEDFVDELRRFGFEGTIKTTQLYRKDLKRHIGICSMHWSLWAFTEHRKRWYRDDRTKKLPSGLVNSKAFWRWFYAGDGCLYVLSPYSYRALLAANDFSTEDVDRLIGLLAELGIKSTKYMKRVTESTGLPQWTIAINHHYDVDRFLEYIGPPVKSIEYKWERPPRQKRVCVGCGVTFTATRNDNTYCTVRCLSKTRSDRYYAKKKAALAR